MPEEESPFPQRKTLPHEPPSWINPDHEIYFITICYAERFGKNSLATDAVASPLIETIRHRNEKRIWWCSTFVAMPDHVHGLFRFPDSNPEEDRSIRRVVRNWKSWTAKSLGIRWQRDWFDHRLRSDENEKEKSDYIRNNPVRAGLVEQADDWPYRFVAEW